MLNNALEFVSQHFFLVLLFCLVLILIILFEIMSSKKNIGIHPKVVVELINKNKAILLDTRSKIMFEKGHIINSLNIKKEDFLKNKKNKKYIKKQIVLIAETSNKDRKFVIQLHQYGFIKVEYLQGGIQSWIDAELPIIKK